MKISPLAFVLLAASLQGQVSRNVELLGRFEVQPRPGYNDVWGHVAPDGREYALLGSTRGTHVVDTTAARSPVGRGFFSGPVSTWRDIKTFGPWAYVVTEGGAGVQVVDLRSPDKPRLAATRFTSGAWRRAHNIGMDFRRGHAYVHGTGRGIFVLDVARNPTDPPLLRRFGGNYIHDLAVQNGLLHAAEIYAGSYAVYDVSQLSKRRLGAVSTHGATHNCWPTEDDKFCVVTNEDVGGVVSFVDLSDRSRPRVVATYRAGSGGAIPHNAYVRDYVAYISYYVEGLRVVDMSDPAKPVEVGYYDTYKEGIIGGFIGAWGCFPFTASGNVFVSDTESGLWVVKPKASPVAHGVATPGAPGVPTVHPHGAPYLGNGRFRIVLRNGRPNSVAFLLLGSRRADVRVGELRLHVDLTGPSLLLPLATDAAGGVSLPAPLPPDGKLAGGRLVAQFVVVDPGAKGGLSGTRGMELELFRR